MRSLGELSVFTQILLGEHIEKGDFSGLRRSLLGLYDEGAIAVDLLTSSLEVTLWWEQKRVRSQSWGSLYHRGDYWLAVYFSAKRQFAQSHFFLYFSKHFYHYLFQEILLVLDHLEEVSEEDFAPISQKIPHFPLYLSAIHPRDKDREYRISYFRAFCHKKLEAYETARDILQKLAILKRKPYVLAQLADVCGFLGQDKYMKILLRESLFLARQDIGEQFLDSLFIEGLIRIYEKEYSGDPSAFVYWLAVWTEADGVFDVQRKLTSREVDGLRQRIYQLKRDLQEDKRRQRHIIRPMLLSAYLWLLTDYHNKGMEQVDPSRVRQLELDIKQLDGVLYQRLMRRA